MRLPRSTWWDRSGASPSSQSSQDPCSVSPWGSVPLRQERINWPQITGGWCLRCLQWSHFSNSCSWIPCTGTNRQFSLFWTKEMRQRHGRFFVSFQSDWTFQNRFIMTKTSSMLLSTSGRPISRLETQSSKTSVKLYAILSTRRQLGSDFVSLVLIIHTVL